MNAPAKIQPRSIDTDRIEAERLVGELNRQVMLINEIADTSIDPVTIAELRRPATALRFAAGLLHAYQAGLAVSTPDPETGLMLVERFAVEDASPPADEVVLIWVADGQENSPPWLGHIDDRGRWWYVDSGTPQHVTHWARRPGVGQ